MVNFVEALAQLEGIIVRSMDQGKNPIVLIDGHAGSGKTKFASDLQDRIFTKEKVSVRIVHMDDLYAGWEGLAAGSRYLVGNLLQPLAANKKATWQIWNWATSQRGSDSEPGNGWREFDGSVPLIVEGCGSLSRASKELADILVWIDSNPKTRKARLIERDGDQFDEYWPIWTIQEDGFYQEEKSPQLADLTVTN